MIFDANLATTMNKVLRVSPRNYPRLHHLFRKIYRIIINSPEPYLQAKISEVFKNYDKVYFIQIGSNDGITGDPIHNLIIENTHYSGIFIEPVEFCFEKLINTYKNSKNGSKRLIFENVAIGLTKEKRSFYYLAQDTQERLSKKLPITYDQLGSFDIII